jgi:excisionase family DNA binding protein
MTEDFNPTEWITTKEAAELTGYHAVHIRRLLREGTIEGRKFGRDWMIDRESPQEYTGRM